jgi:hypothetical protein
MHTHLRLPRTVNGLPVVILNSPECRQGPSVTTGNPSEKR